MELKGCTVMVTGGAKRVGKAICLAFAERGASVIVHYRTSRPEAEATVREVEARGVPGKAIGADLSRSGDISRLVREAEAWRGGVDVLVNNASVYIRCGFDALTEDVWDTTLATNLKAPFLCSLPIGRAMRARGRGKIVNIGDWAGMRPYSNYLPYCVSKAGVHALTKALAKALAPEVQVNCVAPGPVLLPEEVGEAERKAIVRATPLGRLGSPDDVARTVVFLAEQGDFVTGAIYLVDGGRLIA